MARKAMRDELVKRSWILKAASRAIRHARSAIRINSPCVASGFCLPGPLADFATGLAYGMATKETPQQYTKRILGYIDGKDPLKIQKSTSKKLQKLIKPLSKKQLKR